MQIIKNKRCGILGSAAFASIATICLLRYKTESEYIKVDYHLHRRHSANARISTVACEEVKAAYENVH